MMRMFFFFVVLFCLICNDCFCGNHNICEEIKITFFANIETNAIVILLLGVFMALSAPQTTQRSRAVL